MQPNNPIVGGTVLRIPAIQSPNFVEGVSGWAIFQDGTAEFNDIVIVGGQITIGEAPNTQIMFDTTAKDPQGNPLAREIFTTNAATELQPAAMQAQYVAASDIIEMFVQGPGSSDAGFQGMYGWQFQSGSTDLAIGPSMTLYYIDGSGTFHVLWSSHAGGPIQANVPTLFDTWHNVTLNNGWTVNQPCQCRFDTSGFIRLRGELNPGTIADGTVAITLPAGYLPPAGGALLTPALGLSGAYTGGQPRLAVNDTTGTIEIFGITAGVATISLAGLTFPSATWTP